MCIDLNNQPFANASYQANFDGKSSAYDGKAGVGASWWARLSGG